MFIRHACSQDLKSHFQASFCALCLRVHMNTCAYIEHCAPANTLIMWSRNWVSPPSSFSDVSGPGTRCKREAALSTSGYMSQDTIECKIMASKPHMRQKEDRFEWCRFSPEVGCIGTGTHAVATSPFPSPSAPSAPPGTPWKSIHCCRIDRDRKSDRSNATATACALI